MPENCTSAARSSPENVGVVFRRWQVILGRPGPIISGREMINVQWYQMRAAAPDPTAYVSCGGFSGEL